MTHAVITAAALAGAVWLGGHATRGTWWLLAVVAFCALFAVRDVGPKRFSHDVVVGVALAAGITVATYFYVKSGSWLWELFGVGYATHLAVDTLSRAGVPLFWPLDVLFVGHEVRIRVPFEPVPVNSKREHVVAVVAALAAAFLLWELLVPSYKI